MTTPTRRMDRGLGSGNLNSFSRLGKSGSIKRRSMLGRRKSMSGPINETKLLAGISNPQSISLSSKKPLKSQLNLGELLKSQSSVATKYSSKSRLSFGSSSSASSTFDYKSKLRSNLPSFESKPRFENFESLLASFEKSKHNLNSSKLGKRANPMSNASLIESVLSSMKKSHTSINETSHGKPLSSSEKRTSSSCKQLSSTEPKPSSSKSNPSLNSSVGGGSKTLRKALFDAQVDIKLSKESNLENSVLAIPLTTSGKIETSDEENVESIQELVLRKRALSSIAESADDSTDSVAEFLSIEADCEDKITDAAAPGPSKNVPPITPVLDTNKIDQDYKLDDFKTLKDQSDSLRKKIMDLKNIMEVKRNEFLKEYTVLQKEFDIALNEYMELEDKKCDTNKNFESQTNKENIANTPSPVTCIKKSVKKFQDLSVRFSDSVVSQFALPKTPVTLRKSKLPKRKSMGYTPKSLKKVLTDQVNDLCDS